MSYANRRTNWLRVSPMLLIAATLSLPMTASAQQPQFKVGDRVEVDYLLLDNPTKFHNGTIVEIDRSGRSYVGEVDPLPGKLPLKYNIPFASRQSIRALAGGAGPNIPSEKLRVDENDTVLADREILDCEHFNPRGRNGAPPSTELATKLIRCTFEKPAEPGMDGAKTMDITALTIGAPHRWTVLDSGQGNASTLVYPVRVMRNEKIFYRTRNVLTTGKETMFTCLVNTTGQGQCGSASGPRKEGKTVEIRVVK